MPKPTKPMVVEFRDLSDAHVAALERHPAGLAPPVQSRNDPSRWIIGFGQHALTSDDLFASLCEWANGAGLPAPRRRT